MIYLVGAVASFLKSGMVKVPDAVRFDSGGLFSQWRDEVLADFADHPAGLAAAKPTQKVRFHEMAPELWSLCSALLGGDDAVDESWFVNGPVANIGPNPHQHLGWHIDGDCFIHQLKSPEQGLLLIVLWTDVDETNGPTLALLDSVGPVAQALQSSPTGCAQMDLPYDQIVKRCEAPTALTGKAGDVFAIHPLVVHTASPKLSPGIRLISNPVIRRKRPFDFSKGGDCPVAKYTLAQLNPG